MQSGTNRRAASYGHALLLRGAIAWAALALLAALSLSPRAAEAEIPVLTPVRGPLLVGQFRTHRELIAMTTEDQRNTLIVELANRTADSVPFYQRLNDRELAGAGALLVYLRRAGSRTDAQLKTMRLDDLRNTTIVEVAAQTGRGRDLQGETNLELARLVLGPDRGYIRGALLIGGFRRQAELLQMSGEDHRNTLITELAGRTRDDMRFYQGLSDADLGGAGAVLVFLRLARIRTDAELKSMRLDDLRNTMIVEMAGQTRRADLQALTNAQLARTALGYVELPNAANLPEPLRPGRHVALLPVNRYLNAVQKRAYSDVPVVGTFSGRGTDCRGIWSWNPGVQGSGFDFSAFVGWGQVEGSGHPDANSDQCVSLIFQLNVDFDLAPMRDVPLTAVERATFTYREVDGGDCVALEYAAQMGLATDRLGCWTNGSGEPELKPNGCLAVLAPTEDWVTTPPRGRLVSYDGGGDTGIRRLGPSEWDVTAMYRRLYLPSFGPQWPGRGLMLIGEPLTTRNLTADDNTRCLSRVSELQLRVEYTIPAIQPQYDEPVR